MSNTQLTISQALNSTDAKTKFQELLGKRSTQFITSVLSVVNNNALLKNASWQSIYQAAITAATLDLPINQNLGFAYIVPYKEKGEGVAQFQMGYKGFIQLAQRTGLYKTINVSDVREGEIEEFDRLTGQIKFNWIQDDSRLNKKVIGYVSYFELLNGFSKLMYMTIEELEKHGSTFSKSYNSTKTDWKTKNEEYTGLWRTNFEAMAQKTVLKLLLSKYAPMSTEMQLAREADQAVLTEGKVEYPDNSNAGQVTDVKVTSELQKFIEEEVSTLEALMAVESQIKTEGEQLAFEKKMEILNQKTE